MVIITKDYKVQLPPHVLEVLGWKPDDELLILMDKKSITLEKAEMDLAQYRKLIKTASD
tara:strand:+ start:164 stop:340 length:177 start_codon:yes stop_codon:yes gene_type:complete